MSSRKIARESAAQSVCRRATEEYVIPGMNHADGCIETFLIYPWNCPSYESLCLLARREPNDGHDPQTVWHYVLSSCTNYKELEQHFQHWARDWPLCESCAALQHADEPHGLDINCTLCMDSVDNMREDADEWLRAAELGIARWAAKRWPELDLEAATSRYTGTVHNSGFDARQLAATPLELWQNDAQERSDR